MKEKETKLSAYFELPNQGLRAYLDRVAKGQPDEYRTTFYKGKELSEILSGWNDTLRSIATKWPSLYEFESDLAKKVGPMSIMKPLDQRMEDIRSYYDLISLDQTPIPAEALNRALVEWRKAFGLRLRSQEATVAKMKKSTNSGSPYFTKRRNVVDKTLPVAVFSDIYHDTAGQPLVVQELGPRARSWDSAAVLGWRGQEGGPEIDDVKQRVVWMFPFGINIAELQVYQPLIEAAQHLDIIPAWVGMDAVDREVTRLFDTKGRNDLIICTDFSKFDQHFNPVCQDAAKYMLQQILSNDYQSDEWLAEVFPVKYDIPLVIGWDKVLTGKHGMGSGSGGTNADETLVHRALQHEAALNAGRQLNPHSQCLGDDGILSYPGCAVDDVLQTYTAHGLEMNPDKQYVSKQDCTYLRRWHHVDYRVNGICVGVYSTMRALGRLAEQERFYDPEIWNSRMVALRQLSIIENVKYHPLREEFADYCMKGDKYKLGLEIPGFLDEIDQLAKEATEYMPDFLGYTQTLGRERDPSRGISDWWIVNYLKSKR